MNIEFRPQDAIERPTIAKQIAEALKDAIVWLDLKPGDGISESEIASRFGVSRQPVREAFIQLADQGLLRVRPQRATEVVRISVRDVLNATFVRMALEVALSRRAALASGGVGKDHFEDVLARQETAVQADDYKAFQALDDEFHRMIATLAGKDHVWRLIDHQKAQMDRVRYLSLGLGMAQTVEEHRRIVEPIMAGDGEGAERAMEEHLSKIEAKVWDLRERHMTFFVPDESPDDITL
ncbi:MAG: GntR family transcriptional regulator [Rhizobiaceae bacterium]|nr:GntR family transcriptional regulator [Rhizobiaceae bacterium]